MVILINECKKLAIKVTPPDINVSFDDFRPVNNQTISYGLNAIKNVGSKALNAIIEKREEFGHYKSIFDLCERVDQQKVNKRVLESLIMSGAMDSLEGHRAQQFGAVDDAVRYGQNMHSNKNQDQVDIFSNENAGNNLIRIPSLPSVAEWNEQESLNTFMSEVLSGTEPMETQQQTNVPPSQPTETGGLMTSPQNMEQV